MQHNMHVVKNGVFSKGYVRGFNKLLLCFFNLSPTFCIFPKVGSYKSPLLTPNQQGCIRTHFVVTISRNNPNAEVSECPMTVSSGALLATT